MCLKAWQAIRLMDMACPLDIVQPDIAPAMPLQLLTHPLHRLPLQQGLAQGAGELQIASHVVVQEKNTIMARPVSQLIRNMYRIVACVMVLDDVAFVAEKEVYNLLIIANAANIDKLNCKGVRLIKVECPCNYYYQWLPVAHGLARPQPQSRIPGIASVHQGERRLLPRNWCHGGTAWR